MKEIYYVYNNEAISSCIFLSILNSVDNLDVARACLVLPFLLDDRTVNYLLKNKNAQFDLKQLIKEKPILFTSFNKRYLSLLPIAINSLILLNKSNQIKIGQNITINSSLNLENQNLGERFKKIKEVIPIFMIMIENYSTEQLYKTLNIQL